MFYAFALLVIAASTLGAPGAGSKPLIVLSFDGIGAEIQEKLTSLQSFGNLASVKSVKSVFPTKTFSTHFSVATGVKPAVHGVIGNTQYNKEDKKVRNHRDQWRFVPHILPVWVENEKNGGNSGTMMWPGAQLLYGGSVIDEKKEFPTNYKDDGTDKDEEEDGSQKDDDNYQNGTRADYNVDYIPNSLDWYARIDKIIEWVKTGGSSVGKANLVMAYFEDYGSLKINERDAKREKHIQNINDIITYFKTQLEKASLYEKVDIIFLSDHGTHASEAKDIVKIDEILEITDEDNNILATGPLAYISPEKNEIKKALQQLRESTENDKYKVYEKFELKWDMKNSKSVLEQIITVVAEPPYTFFTAKQLKKISDSDHIKESEISQFLNGYDNDEESMNGFFYGHGPSFKNNEFVDGTFDLDEVYPLIKLLIGLPLQSANDVQTNNSVDDVVKKLLEPAVVARITYE